MENEMLDNEIELDQIDDSIDENVATLLPNVGLNGETLTKSPRLEKGLNVVMRFTESVLDYIKNPDYEYSYYVQEEVEKNAKEFADELKISESTFKLIEKIAILNYKIQVAKEKKEDSKKIKDMQKELKSLIDKFNKVKESSVPELQKNIQKAEKIIIKNVKDELEKSEKGEKKKEDKKDNPKKKELKSSEKKETKKEDKNKKPESEESKKVTKLKDEISDLESQRNEAIRRLEETGERRFENMSKGLNSKIETKKKELNKLVSEAFDDLILEAREIEHEMKPIVDKLNAKGYHVKYASPGHKKMRKKTDKYRDGIFYGHLYTDARVMFDKKYGITTPKYWFLRDVDGCDYLDVRSLKYDQNDGTPDEAFAKWKTNYMNSLRDFADSLGENKKEDKSEKEDKEEKNEVKEESVNFFEFVDEMIDSLDNDDFINSYY